MESGIRFSRLHPTSEVLWSCCGLRLPAGRGRCNAEHFNRLCPTPAILQHTGLPLGLMVAFPFLVGESSLLGPLVLHHEPSYFLALQMSITENSASALVDPNNSPTAHPL